MTTLKDLFRIRDALSILDTYNLADVTLYQEINRDIERIARGGNRKDTERRD